MNYEEITGWLQGKDDFAISKLAIYHELRGDAIDEELSEDEVGMLVDRLMQVYLQTGISLMSAPQCAVCAMRIGGTLRELLVMDHGRLQEQVERNFERMCIE